MIGFWYLATPYSKHPRGIEVAYQEACVAAAVCFSSGVFVFSPITHTHGIALAGDLAGHFEQWAEFDRIMIAASNGMIVVKMDGYDASVGIAAEIALCREMGKPVAYMMPGGPIPILAMAPEVFGEPKNTR